MAHTKIFKEVTGTSLGKYIRQRRLAGAIHLLRTSERSIFDIALDFGFGSQSHFTYMFRKEYGITPFRLSAKSRDRFRNQTAITFTITLL